MYFLNESVSDRSVGADLERKTLQAGFKSENSHGFAFREVLDVDFRLNFKKILRFREN